MSGTRKEFVRQARNLRKDRGVLVLDPEAVAALRRMVNGEGHVSLGKPWIKTTYEDLAIVRAALEVTDGT